MGKCVHGPPDGKYVSGALTKLTTTKLFTTEPRGERPIKDPRTENDMAGKT